MNDRHRLIIKSASVLAVTVMVAASAAWLATCHGNAPKAARPIPTPARGFPSVDRGPVLTQGDPQPARPEASPKKAETPRDPENVPAAPRNAAAGISTGSPVAANLERPGTPEEVQALLSAIVSERDPATRRFLSESLKELSDRQGTEALVSALAATRDPAVVKGVLDAVERMADGETVAFLLELYREPPSVRGQQRAVLRALGSIRNPEAARALANVARQAPEPGLVEAAARSLAKIGNPAAVSGLVAAFENPLAREDTMRSTLLAMVARTDHPASTRHLESLLFQDGIPDDLRAALMAAGNGRGAHSSPSPEF